MSARVEKGSWEEKKNIDGLFSSVFFPSRSLSFPPSGFRPPLRVLPSYLVDRDQHGCPGADARDGEQGLARGDVNHFFFFDGDASLFFSGPFPSLSAATLTASFLVRAKEVRPRVCAWSRDEEKTERVPCGGLLNNAASDNDAASPPRVARKKKSGRCRHNFFQ